MINMMLILTASVFKESQCCRYGVYNANLRNDFDYYSKRNFVVDDHYNHNLQILSFENHQIHTLSALLDSKHFVTKRK